MSYNSGSPPTIDDEFASLFLKPMATTSSNKQNHENQNHGNQQLSQNLPESDQNHSEIEYLNGIDFQQQNEGINIGLANYARYLPVETTMSNTLFDFPEMSYLNTAQSTNMSPSLSDNYKSNSDLAMHFHHLQGFNHTTSSKSNNINLTTHEDDLTKEGNLRPETKRQKTAVTNSTPLHQYVDQNLLLHVANKMLTLESTTGSNDTNIFLDDGTKVMLDFDARLSGRLFVSPDVFESPTDEIVKRSNIYGYRRNSIAVSFNIKIVHFDTDDQGLCINLSPKNEKFCKRIKLELYASLRKIDPKSDPPRTIQLDDEIELDFTNDINFIKRKKIHIGKAHYEIDTDSLKSEKSLDLVWYQVKFASATASNKYDAAKFNVIICCVKFLDENGEIIKTKEFESNPIISRGRNPSFYNDRNEIMIGKIMRNSFPQSLLITHKISEDESDKEQVSESPASTTAVEKSIIEEVLENTDLDKDNIEPTSNPKKNIPAPQVASSSYTYFKVDEHYYLPPVDVGYFPHHVHHNKQVFTSVTSAGNNQDGKTHKYNYYI